MTRAFALAALLSANAFAQTVDGKLNGLGFTVKDLAAVKPIYSGLGFAVNDTSVVGFRDGGTLEFYEHKDIPYEGPRRADIIVSSAGQTARNLSNSGTKMKPPVPGSRVFPLPMGMTTLKWLSLDFDERLPSRPIYFIEILNTPEIEAALPRPPHPNTAFEMKAILVAVNDLEKAAAGYANIGKLSAREIPMPALGAVAKEIVLQRGSILLLRATDPSGPVARRLAAEGEGNMGVQLTVKDLAQTRKAVGEKNISKDKRYVLVAPENAAGTWLQFQP
jgi:hypothetical protein